MESMFLGWLGKKLCDALFKEVWDSAKKSPFQKTLNEKLSGVVADWMNGLPDHGGLHRISLFPHALPKDVLAEQPQLTIVLDLLDRQLVPNQDQWNAALVEQWLRMRTSFAAHDEIPAFYKLSEADAIGHISRLAAALEVSCKQAESLYRMQMFEWAKEVREAVLGLPSQLENSLASLSRVAEPRDHKALSPRLSDEQREKYLDKLSSNEAIKTFLGTRSAILKCKRTFDLSFEAGDGGDRESRDKTIAKGAHELFAWIVENGASRFILTGSAGIGKSTILVELVWLSVVSARFVPLYVNLAGPEIQSDHIGRELFLPVDSREAYTANLQRLADLAYPGDIGVEFFEKLCTCDRQLFVVVDALNELSNHQSRKNCVATLEKFVRDCPGQQPIVLVSQRPASPIYRNWKWVEALGVPISDADSAIQATAGESVRLTDGLKDLVTKPFFLDKMLDAISPDKADGNAKLEDLRSPARVIAWYLEQRCKLEAEDIRLMQQVAYEGYLDCHRAGVGRAFADRSSNTTQDPRLKRMVERCTTAGIILKDKAKGGWLKFEHQLIHDYLAARVLCDRPSEWTWEVFDAVTLDTASVDVLGMVLELLSTVGERDRFLERVYDWNWRAALTAVGLAECFENGCCSQHIKVVLVAMVAEKAQDIAAHTRSGAGLALVDFRRMQGDLVAPFVGVDVPTIVDIIGEREHSIRRSAESAGASWIGEWLDLFRRQPGKTELSSREVKSITNANSIVGWNAANVIKRFSPGMSEECQQQLRYYYEAIEEVRNENPVVCWRVVHTLGAFSSMENRQLLLGAVEKGLTNARFRWVGYGAARSLVEHASRDIDSPALQELVLILRRCFDWISEKAVTPEARRLEANQQIILKEVARTLRLHAPPDGWGQRIGSIVSSLRVLRGENIDNEWFRWDEEISRVMEESIL